MSFVGSTESIATNNTAFRRVVYTGDELQLVAMCLRTGEDIGTETHARVEQQIQIVPGSAVVTLDRKRYSVSRGDTIIVPPGVRHNLKNTGPFSLRLLTTYSPPNHPPSTVHPTKADARADKKDAAFSARVNR